MGYSPTTPCGQCVWFGTPTPLLRWCCVCFTAFGQSYTRDRLTSVKSQRFRDLHRDIVLQVRAKHYMSSRGHTINGAWWPCFLKFPKLGIMFIVSFCIFPTRNQNKWQQNDKEMTKKWQQHDNRMKNKLECQKMSTKWQPFLIFDFPVFAGPTFS